MIQKSWLKSGAHMTGKSAGSNAGWSWVESGDLWENVSCDVSSSQSSSCPRTADGVMSVVLGKNE